MNASFKIITGIGRNRRLAALVAGCLTASGAWALTPADLADPAAALARTKTPATLAEQLLDAGRNQAVAQFRATLESEGQAEPANRVRSVEELYSGNYAGALQALALTGQNDAWRQTREAYLTRLAAIHSGFTEQRSDHFILRLPSEDAFLATYALPALEIAYGKMTAAFGIAPEVPVVAEIYPDPDSFSAASLIPKEALERTGAIGTCRYGKLMILSPGATALGYRWLDALVHEYVHLVVNRVSGGLAPLWIHEGTARYWETMYRRTGRFSLAPPDESLLGRSVLQSTDAPKLLAFAEMEPSFVNLPNQTAVALAYAEAADAVAFWTEEFSSEKPGNLLRAFSTWPRDQAFQQAAGISESDFEKAWRESLSTETWKPAAGAIPQTIHLGPMDELALADVDVQGHLRLGDRLRAQNQLSAALAQYQKAEVLAPDNGVVLARLGRAYADSEKFSQAEKALRHATETNPAYVTPFVLLGDRYFDDGKYEEAQAILQGALEINPFHPKIHEILGLIAVDVGQFPEARRSLELALRLDPNNDQIRQALKNMPKNR